MEEYSAFAILENMVEQINGNVLDANLFDEALSVRKDDNIALKKGPDAFITIGGVRKTVITTNGWDV